MPSVMINAKDLRFTELIPDLEAMLAHKLKEAANLSLGKTKQSQLEPLEKIALSMGAGVEPRIRISEDIITIETPEVDFAKNGNWRVTTRC